MARLPVSITVVERPHLQDTPYIVTQIVNATDWPIGKQLSKEQVDIIIANGTKVIIKG